MGTKEVSILLTYGAHREARVTFEAEDDEELNMAEAMVELSRMYGVPNDGRVTLNGGAAEPTAVIKDGDKIEVQRATGTKG